MKSAIFVSALAFLVTIVIGLGTAYGLNACWPSWTTFLIIAGTVLVAFIAYSSSQVADQGDKAVELRDGRFQD